MFGIVSYIKYSIKRLLAFALLIVILLAGAGWAINKFTPKDEGVKIENTTNNQSQVERKSEDEISQERQNQFKADDEARLKSAQNKRESESRENSKADKIWTDDNGKNVVQPHINEEQQKIKDNASDSVNTRPDASGKSFLGDDIK